MTENVTPLYRVSFLTCPHCGAEPEKPCVTVSGKTLPVGHTHEGRPYQQVQIPRKGR